MRRTNVIWSITLGLLVFGGEHFLFAQSPKLDRSVPTAENREPAIPQPEQDKAVAEKLAALRKKTGRRPNILWFVAPKDVGL